MGSKMFELTKANIDIGYVGQWEDPNTWQCTLQFFESKEEAEKVKQQLLDDYEKARQWDKATALENRPDIATIMERNSQNQKLRELLEKEIPKCKQACEESIKSQTQVGYYHGLSDGYGIVLQLLEDSKK